MLQQQLMQVTDWPTEGEACLVARETAEGAVQDVSVSGGGGQQAHTLGTQHVPAAKDHGTAVGGFICAEAERLHTHLTLQQVCVHGSQQGLH